MNHFIIVIFSLFLLLASCNNYHTDKNRVIEIGKSIINIDTTKTGRPIISDVVFIGDGLIEKVLLLKRNATSYSYKVKDGDFEDPYGSGNGKADCILTINTDFHDVGIRLKYNKAKDKYDILGWMTLK